MALHFLATKAEIDAASPADRADWNRRVDAWLFGVDLGAHTEDEAVDRGIHAENQEWCGA